MMSTRSFRWGQGRFLRGAMASPRWGLKKGKWKATSFGHFSEQISSMANHFFGSSPPRISVSHSAHRPWAIKSRYQRSTKLCRYVFGKWCLTRRMEKYWKGFRYSLPNYPNWSSMCPSTLSRKELISSNIDITVEVTSDGWSSDTKVRTNRRTNLPLKTTAVAYSWLPVSPKWGSRPLKPFLTVALISDGGYDQWKTTSSCFSQSPTIATALEWTTKRAAVSSRWPRKRIRPNG